MRNAEHSFFIALEILFFLNIEKMLQKINMCRETLKTCFQKVDKIM